MPAGCGQRQTRIKTPENRLPGLIPGLDQKPSIFYGKMDGITIVPHGLTGGIPLGQREALHHNDSTKASFSQASLLPGDVPAGTFSICGSLEIKLPDRRDSAVW